MSLVFNDYNYVISKKKSAAMNECTSFAGHFDGHDDAPVRCQAQCPIPILHVNGYPKCHWMPPMGKNLPCINPADAMVIDFGKQNKLWCCEITFQS